MFVDTLIKIKRQREKGNSTEKVRKSIDSLVVEVKETCNRLPNRARGWPALAVRCEKTFGGWYAGTYSLTICTRCLAATEGYRGRIGVVRAYTYFKLRLNCVVEFVHPCRNFSVLGFIYSFIP